MQNSLVNDVSNVVVEVMPEGSLEVLSHQEIDRLRETGIGGKHELLRRCALAVLNSGSSTDSAREVLEQFRDFDIGINQQDYGVTLSLKNPPEKAFVDGKMIRGTRELLFAVLRDIAFIDPQTFAGGSDSGHGVTNRVFEILRNAGVLYSGAEPDLVVCWGGHSIGRAEYEYCKEVGYQLGLREFDVCTGCGPGSMKGPMKGAAIGHAKQRVSNGRYIGVTEPGIIAAEPPNPIVNQLVIMPDMEKRLEAFVRISHAIVVFPGGVGTMEEILYLLGILMHPENREIPVPLVFTGPPESAGYFQRIDDFIATVLGEEAQQRYQIKLGEPSDVAAMVKSGIEEVRKFRRRHQDAFFFNWHLTIDPEFQRRFEVTHENMAALKIDRDQDAHTLAINLRRAFSGLVAGNIRDEGARAIEAHGPFEIYGERELMKKLDALLASFIEQQRMRLPGKPYEPCYRIVS